MIKVQKLYQDAQLPVKKHPNDAGYDIFAIDNGWYKGEYIEYKTGIAVEPPDGYYLEVVPRSSISNTNLILANSVGIIDPSYRGEIILRFKLNCPYENAKIYEKGDRIGQLILRHLNLQEIVECDILSETNRGNSGFGSTGK